MILVIGGAFQGKLNFALNKFDTTEDKIFNNFHVAVKSCIEKGCSLEKLIESTSAYEVVICDEVGCGIVPLNKADRIWREEVGRALCTLAKNSEEVWRVSCGVGVCIKG